MKKLLILLILTGAGASLMAQNKVEKYCIIRVNNDVALTKNVIVKLDPGYQDPSFSFKDSSVVYNLKLVENQTSLMGAFNCLASLGWKYVNSLGIDTHRKFLYCFSKTFDASELK